MNSDEACPRVEALSALVDDALSEPERLALMAHVQRCPSCAPVWDTMRALRAQFAALPDPAGAFDLAPEIDRRISTPAPDRPSRPAPADARARRRWRDLALLAPGGAAALALGIWLGASLMPYAALSHADASAAQMAVFSSMPPGAMCLAPGSCGGPSR